MTSGKVEFPFTVEHEKSQQDARSPGKVHDAENLKRWFFEGHVDHIDPDTNEVLPSAISRTDLTSSGLSVDRENYIKWAKVDDRIVKQLASHQTKNPHGRYFPQIATFTTEDVRAIRDDAGDRAFVVIDVLDDSDPENIAHAGIFSATKRGKGGIKEIRVKLAKLFNNRTRHAVVEALELEKNDA